jgi:hypothetical protein
VELRYLVRELMIGFLQANYPSALPTVRLSMLSEANGLENAAPAGRHEP